MGVVTGKEKVLIMEFNSGRECFVPEAALKWETVILVLDLVSMTMKDLKEVSLICPASFIELVNVCKNSLKFGRNMNHLKLRK
nr:hypothetical protein GOBAR_AA36422 [Ipomoea batatas]